MPEVSCIQQKISCDYLEKLKKLQTRQSRTSGSWKGQVVQDGQKNAEQMTSLRSWNTEQWKGQGASQKQHLEQLKDIPSPRCLFQPKDNAASEYLTLEIHKPCLQLYTSHGENGCKDSLKVT